MWILLRRLIAFSLDCLILFLLFAAPQFLILTITGRWFLDEDSSNVLTWAWVGVSVTLPSLAYFTLCDSSRRGMTIGKRMLGLSVRSTRGHCVTWGQALGRNIVKLIPWEATHIMIFFPEPFGDDDPSPGKITLMVVANVLVLLWLVAPLSDRPRFRALHDRVSATVVVAAGVGSGTQHIT